MKIGQDVRVSVDGLKQGQLPAHLQNGRFQSIVTAQQSKLHNQQLKQLYQDIGVVASQLGRSRNFRDLAKFKTLVKRFVKEATDFGLDVKQSKQWNEYGESRTFRIVETIDEKLVALTEAMRTNEQDSLKLLEMIGEIKGLLVNLYV
ncbi:YaaR family protein [Bacillus fonticola]|uniref:YaaR family protein n=1 Tax=Bacillus fonticola TaxID=2728853 RepID=UPI001472E9AF|nr:DUF327 family protein [Bacillus fonticola]